MWYITTCNISLEKKPEHYLVFPVLSRTSLSVFVLSPTPLAVVAAPGPDELLQVRRGRILLDMGHIDMCGPKVWGFSTVLVINSVLHCFGNVS